MLIDTELKESNIVMGIGLVPVWQFRVKRCVVRWQTEEAISCRYLPSNPFARLCGSLFES